MNVCEARGRYEKRGGGGVLSALGRSKSRGGGGGDAVRFRPDTKSGGGGGGGGGGCSLLQVRYEKWWGGAACRTMILYILVCARVRDSAWGMERGGAAISPRGRHFV